ncbi:membrane protein [Neiella marina]|uniref:Membrane protein n=1 Tax=Neiella marina TaxID=508461 RepID=A0A8J2XPW0_9GAMM|nr:DUF2069 domain-containing protein [Neiella marina]GGA82172.1 membrane protein [Neiella marina]
MQKVTAVCWLSKVGYFGLYALIVLWQGVLSPHPHVSSLWLTVLWLVPLLFPLRGIIANNPYTHAWSTFIALLYLMHGCVQIYVEPAERWLAFIEIVLVSCWLVGSILFARWRGKQLGLGLKKRNNAKPSSDQ